MTAHHLPSPQSVQTEAIRHQFIDEGVLVTFQFSAGNKREQNKCKKKVKKMRSIKVKMPECPNVLSTLSVTVPCLPLFLDFYFQSINFMTYPESRCNMFKCANQLMAAGRCVKRVKLHLKL